MNTTKQPHSTTSPVPKRRTHHRNQSLKIADWFIPLRRESLKLPVFRVAGNLMMAIKIATESSLFRSHDNAGNRWIKLPPRSAILKATIWAGDLHVGRRTIYERLDALKRAGITAHTTAHGCTLITLTDTAFPDIAKKTPHTISDTPPYTPGDISITDNSNIDDEDGTLQLTDEMRLKAETQRKKIKRETGRSALCVDLRKRLRVDEETANWIIAGVCHRACYDCALEDCRAELQDYLARIQDTHIQKPRAYAQKIFSQERR